MKTWLVLLRGINVGGHRKVPMAELRALTGDLGFEDVQTYIQSGNLLGRREGTADEIGALFEEALEEHFGFEIDVIVRDASVLDGLARGGVFPDAEDERANLVHVVFGHHAPGPGVLDIIDPYRDETESVKLAHDHLWIDYASGSARSKITHDVLRRAFDGPVTSRNFKTVRRLHRLLETCDPAAV